MMHGTNRQLVGGIGVLILMLGVFGPFLKYPILGSIFFISYNINVFLLILFLTLTSCLIIVTNRCSWLWYSGSIAAIIVIGTCYAAKTELLSVDRLPKRMELPREVFSVMRSAYVEGQFALGAFFLVIGSLTLVACAAMGESKGGSSEKLPFDSTRIGNAGNVIAKNFSGISSVYQNVQASQEFAAGLIDVVVCTPHGLFPISVKNYRGILRSENDTTWIQVIDGVETRIPNPLIDIVVLSKTLAKTLSSKDEWISPMVALVGEPIIEFSLPEGIHHLADVIFEIQSQTRSRYHNGIFVALKSRLNRLGSGQRA